MKAALTTDNQSYLGTLQKEFQFGSYSPGLKKVMSGVIRIVKSGDEQARIQDWKLDQALYVGDQEYKLGGTATAVVNTVLTSLSHELNGTQMISKVVNGIIAHVRYNVDKEVVRAQLKSYLHLKDFEDRKKKDRLGFDLPEDVVESLRAAAAKTELQLYMETVLKKAFHGMLTDEAREKLLAASARTQPLKVKFAKTSVFVALTVGAQIKSTLERAADNELEPLLRNFFYEHVLMQTVPS